MADLSIAMTEIEMARLALGHAADIRKKAGIPFNIPLSIYDLCASMGIEVRFVNISMEGNYLPGKKPVFLISALRPAVRRVFTCAHELGHHVFNHGFKLDELVESRPSKDKTPEEFMADCFAANLLMPALAVRKAFSYRKWKISNPTAQQIYLVACDFGVGYETLVTQLAVGLKLISYQKYEDLIKVKLDKIEKMFVGDLEIERRLLVVDTHWLSPVIECEVGDHILIDAEVTTQNDNLHKLDNLKDKPFFKASRRGVTSIRNKDGSIFKQVRIMAHQYIGLNRYLYLPDPDEDGEEDD